MIRFGDWMISKNTRCLTNFNLPHDFLSRLKNLCDAGNLSEACQNVDLVYKQGLFLPKPMFYSLVRQCIRKEDLSAGRFLHNLFGKHHSVSDSYMGSHFIRMFASCGSLSEAEQVFRELSKPSAFAWSAIISAYAKYHCSKEAIALYQQMLRSDVEPDGHVYVSVIKACANEKALRHGREVHKRIANSCLKPDVVIDNALLDMYMKCGSLKEAHNVFDNTKFKNVVTWNSVIAGYAQHGCMQDAFRIFLDMQKQNIIPNGFTFASILKLCSAPEFLYDGHILYADSVECGCESDKFLKSCLIDMYSKCGSLTDAHNIFDLMQEPTVVTWTTIITGYANYGSTEEVLNLFRRMLDDGPEPNKITLSSVLKACVETNILFARLIHSLILSKTLESDVVIGSGLVDIYAKKGYIEDAWHVFEKLEAKNVVTWSAMIGGYTHCQGQCFKALDLFKKMEIEGLQPDVATFVNVLKACSVVDTVHGRLIHAYAVETAFECHEFVLSSLIDMYAKCFCIEDANAILRNLRNQDMVVWTSMISGYALNGYDEAAIQLFYKMIGVHLVPDIITFVSTLKACSNIKALNEGNLVYAYILEQQTELSLQLTNSIIDMYAACGYMDDSSRVFSTMRIRDTISWTTMVTGYAQLKKYDLALKYYKDMQQVGCNSDNIALISLLSACCQEAQLVEGCEHFDAMKMQNGTHMQDLYNCLIDLLGTSGHLEEAVDLFQCIPFVLDVDGWTCLLNHCKLHNNVSVGRHCFDYVVSKDAKASGAYSLMYNLYKCWGMSENAMFVENLRQSANAWKKPGHAIVQLNDDNLDIAIPV